MSPQSFKCKNNTLSQLTLLQTSSDSTPSSGKNELRQQRLNVGLYYKKGTAEGQNLVLNRSLPVLLSGKKTKVPLEGKIPCPAMIFPNTDDWGYALVTLDSESQKAALNHRAADPLTETIVLGTLTSEVMSGKLSAQALLNRLFQQIPEESTPALLRHSQQVLTRLFHTIQSISSLEENNSRRLIDLLLDIENFTWQQLMIAVPGSSEQQDWLTAFIDVSHSRESLQKLENLLDHRPVLSDLKDSQGLRWKMLIKLNEYEYPGAWKRVQREKSADTSATGKAKAREADAVRPSLTVKQKWINQYLESNQSPSETPLLSAPLFTSSQIQLAQQLSAQAIDGLSLIINQKQLTSNLNSYLKNVIPQGCSESDITRLIKAKKQYKNDKNILNTLERYQALTQACLNVRRSQQ